MMLKRTPPRGTVVYNVLIKGVSVGLTFDRLEAEAWKALGSGSDKEKKIIYVPYRRTE